ncbi:MAG: hypothetical protein IKJ81_06760 [Bacteroidales bacterium]|nr:hypothetical protein [Bacteroidales bacterium]
MGTAIYIILCLVVVGILWATGFLPQFLFLGGGVIGIGLICGTAWWIFGSDFSTGWNVGKWLAVVAWGIINLMMIINDDGFEIEVFSDGRTETHSDRAKGVVGLLASIAMALLFVFWGKF